MRISLSQLQSDSRADGMLMPETATAAELLSALRSVELTLSLVLTKRGYRPGSCTDEWSAEVRAEVAELARVRTVLAKHEREAA